MYPTKEERKIRKESLKTSRDALESQLSKVDNSKKVEMLKYELSKITCELVIIDKLDRLEAM